MTKNAVVRARIEQKLKTEATKVLAGCGLEISDAIRLFLQQVVLRDGIPFSIEVRGKVHHISAQEMRAQEDAAQARDHLSAEPQDPSGGSRLLIQPADLRHAKVHWSKATDARTRISPHPARPPRKPRKSP